MGSPISNTLEDINTTTEIYLALIVLEFSMAIEEAGLLDLWNSLALFKVGKAAPVELTLCFPCLFVHLCHDALDQLQLRRTECL